MDVQDGAGRQEEPRKTRISVDVVKQAMKRVDVRRMLGGRGGEGTIQYSTSQGSSN